MPSGVGHYRIEWYSELKKEWVSAGTLAATGEYEALVLFMVTSGNPSMYITTWVENNQVKHKLRDNTGVDMRATLVYNATRSIER